MAETSYKRVIPLLRNTVTTLIKNPAVLFPFCMIACIQLFILEICYFATRFPLSMFFGPVIRRFFSENYLHYPFNLVILPRLYQNNFVQAFVFIFVTSFLTGLAMSILTTINSGKQIHVRPLLKKMWPSYLHIVVASILSVVLLLVFFKGYGLVMKRALQIRSTGGLFFMVKQAILLGAPYVNLLASVLERTIFAFVLPIIVIDQKKIGAALVGNVRSLFKSFWTVFCVVLVPTLLYVPVLLLRTGGLGAGIPEMGVFMLFVSIFVMLVIDSVVYISLATIYLLQKERT
jgi:hypothetical protein